MVSAVLAVVLVLAAAVVVLCLKILEHLDLLHAGMPVMHENIMKHCSTEAAGRDNWACAEICNDMMQHLVKMFEAFHEQFEAEGVLGGYTGPVEDSPAGDEQPDNEGNAIDWRK